MIRSLLRWELSRGRRPSGPGRATLGTALLALVTVAPPAPAQPLPFTVLAKSGDAAPGTGAGVTFGNTFGPLFIDSSARGAFLAELTGSGVTPANNIGAWVGPAGGLQLAARQGDPAPGLSGLTLVSIGSLPAVNAGGTTAFRGTLAGPGVTANINDRALWVGAAGGLQVLARLGDPAPGTPAGVTFGTTAQVGSGFEDPLLGANGRVTFLGGLVGTGIDTANNQGVWSGIPGNVQLAARRGDPAPGTGAGVNFSDFFIVKTNGSGSILFRGTLTGTGVTAGVNDLGLWAGTVGNLQLLARRGDAAPGVGAGVNYNFFNSHSFSDTGRVAALVTLTGTDVTTANDAAIFTGPGGGLQPFVRKGDNAPGTGAGVTFNTLGTPVGAGETVAFVGGLTGTGVTDGVNNRGIWAGTPGNPQLVARDGDAAPGTPGGVTFDQVCARYIEPSHTQQTTLAAVSPNGAVAFTATLTGTGVTTTNDWGMWMRTADGLFLVARTGDVIDLDPGPGTLNKTIAGLTLFTGFIGPSDGYGEMASLGAGDVVVWRATFTDGSSAVFSTISAVPEPATVLGLAVLGLAAAGYLRRRTGRSSRERKT